MALELSLDKSAGTTQEAPKKASSINAPVLFSRTPTAKDRMFFTEQLSLMLATGTSLHPALLSIGEQMRDTPMQSVIKDMADGVMNGRSLSEEMAKHPRVFSSLYINLVAASENGGFLHEVLEQLQHIEEQNAALRSTLVSAFSYPAFLVVFSIFTLIFVLTVVFPKFSELFTAIGDGLPGSTVVLMAVSGFLINHWLLLSIAIAASIVAGISWARTQQGKQLLDRAKLHTPFFKTIWRQVYLVLMLRVLGLSIQHGVTLVDAVRTSRDVVNNTIVRKFLSNLSDTLQQGGRLSGGLQRADWVPDLAKQMLTTAEETGSIAPVMLRLSDYYNRELDRALQRFSKMIEPIMLVVMGVLVGTLVSAMILPIFKLSSAVG